VFSGQGGGRRKLPYAFTEQGIYMLATVLKEENQKIFYDGQIFDAFSFLSDLNNLDYDDKYYKRRKTDLEDRLSKSYDIIEETGFVPQMGRR